MAYLDERVKLKQQRTNEAIALAMQNKWEEAATVNKSIIEIFPDDVAAYNRLGKALTELGRYTEAREAYAHALEINPHDSIAKKNLDRLSYLKEEAHQPQNTGWVSPNLFIEETGKTEVANLHRLAPKEVLAKIAAGAVVNLKSTAQGVIVESTTGQYIGEIEPKLGLRLLKLMEAGNKYTAAIARLREDSGKVVIKETFRHPSQAERPSFPARSANGFRAYVKDSMLKYELEDEEEAAEEEEASGWEDEPLAEESAVEDTTSLEDELSSEADEEPELEEE